MECAWRQHIMPCGHLSRTRQICSLQISKISICFHPFPELVTNWYQPPCLFELKSSTTLIYWCQITLKSPSIHLLWYDSLWDKDMFWMVHIISSVSIFIMLDSLSKTLVDIKNHLNDIWRLQKSDMSNPLALAILGVTIRVQPSIVFLVC